MLKRQLNIFPFLQKGKSLFLFGPRGVGKSRILGQVEAALPHTFLVDLLKTEIFSHYLSAPHFLRQDVERRLNAGGDQALTVMIDEVQKLPVILDEVHSL